MFREMIKKYFGSMMLLVVLSACGSAEKSNVPSSDQTTSHNGPQVENPLTPGNLPPPGQSALQAQALSLNEGSAFFQRKEVWDSFSPKLKQKVYESYSKTAPVKNGTTYDTLFGRVTIEEKTEVVIVEDEYRSQEQAPELHPEKNNPILAPLGASFSRDKISAQEAKGGGELRTQIFADTAAIGTSGPCSNGATFLCVSSPFDGQGVVVDVLHVDGAIKMNEAAFFGPLDPVAMVSVFKQAGTSPLQRVGEFPILPSDLVPVVYQAPRAADADADPAPVEIGPFQKAVPLSGSGVYQIIVSAWKNTDAQALLETKRFTIYRQSVPQFATEGVKVYPANRANLATRPPTPLCDKLNPIIITSVPANVTLRDICVEAELQEEGTPNVGVIVENYSRNGSALVLNYSGSGEIETSAHSTNHHPIITTLVPVNNGLNHFKVKVRNSLLSTPLPDAALKEFELINQQTQYSLKFSTTSVVDGKIIEPRSEADTVSIQFCISADGTSCVSTWPDTAKPKIFLNSNSIEVPTASILRDSAGQYSAVVHPMVGMNTFNVHVPTANGNSIPDYNAAFGFGKLNKLYENGLLKEQDNFLKRGLSLEINKTVFSTVLKHVLEAFLNKSDFKHTFVNFLKKDTPSTPRPACTIVSSDASPDSGDSTINFLEDTLQLGSFELLEFTPTNENTLRVALRLKGFKGELDLRPLIPGRTTPQVDDYNFIALSLDIGQLDIAIDIAFNKNSEGSQQLVIKEILGRDVIKATPGTDAAGRYIFVNNRRNPFNSDLQAIYGSGNGLGGIFINSIKETLLCGVPHNLNNSQTGLAHWFSDLPKLINYNNQDPFRIPLQFEMLGKQIGIDIAYDILHAQEISFSGRGLKIVNVPLRFTPGPIVLGGVPDAIKNSLIGAISHPDRTFDIPSAAAIDTTDVQNLSLKISEDAINQALFAASFAGMLDIDLDPNFFTNNGIPFIKQATPVPEDLVFTSTANLFFDLNQNGVNDDANLPALLRLRTDKSLSPQIHFLTQAEITEMAAQVKKSSSNLYDLNTSLKYFKFTLPNLEISVYRVQSVSEENGGYQTFCAAKQAQKSEDETRFVVDPIILSGGQTLANYGTACTQNLSVDYITQLNGSCSANYDAVTTPARNAGIISAVEGQTDVPLIKYKTSITLYGVFQGVFREQLLQNKWSVQEQLNQEALITPVPNPPFTNFLRLRFFSENPYKPDIKIKVVENHTSIPSEQLGSSNKIESILNVAVGNNCLKFNEVRIPIPDKFVDDPAVQGDFMEKLIPFGITSLNLGDQTSNLPTIDPDASGLYLDLTAHLGIGYPMVTP